MRRELILNWGPVHETLKEDIEKEVRLFNEFRPVDNGWSYFTFFELGTKREDVLFNLSELEKAAEDNGYFLPDELVRQHNKLVVCANCPEGGNAYQLYALWSLLAGFEKRWSDSRRNPNLSFYGKLGGIYDRPEKGRVLVIYSTSDEALLQIEERLNELFKVAKVPGVEFSVRLANGLSALPRMLHGFNDPSYQSTGVHFFRITDPLRFNILLEQARNDFGNYLFQKYD
jgi:hypothetical protein